MKKYFAMLLALVLLLLTCGCKEEEASHEAPAPTDYEVVREALLNEFEQAREQYVGKTIEWNIPVHRIEKEFSDGLVTDRCVVVHAPVRYADSDAVNFKFYLPQKVMDSLELEQVLRVKGEIYEILMYGETPLVELLDASVVSDTFRVSGEITYIDTFKGTPYCCFTDNSVIPVGACFIVFLPEDHGFSVGDTITMDTILPGGRHVEGISVKYGVRDDDSAYKQTSMTFFLYEDDYTIVE